MFQDGARKPSEVQWQRQDGRHLFRRGRIVGSAPYDALDVDYHVKRRSLATLHLFFDVSHKVFAHEISPQKCASFDAKEPAKEPANRTTSAQAPRKRRLNWAVNQQTKPRTALIWPFSRIASGPMSGDTTSGRLPASSLSTGPLTM